MEEYEEEEPRRRWVVPFIGVLAAAAAGWFAFDYYMDQTWELREAKRMLERRLKDPTSVRYRDIDRCPSGTGVFGIYNAKNSYGAYVGDRIFYVFGLDLTMEDEVYFSRSGPIDPETYCWLGLEAPKEVPKEQWEAMDTLERFYAKMATKKGYS